jgi:putative intracellular protease/amidase
MRKKTCAAFIFEGFVDHQLSLTLACLNLKGNFVLETFSGTGRPVTSAAGLRVTPHTSLRFMQPEDFDVLLLPGGAHWEKGDNLEIFPLITAIAGRRPQGQTYIIAIGEAILGLADLGLLNNIPHTGLYPTHIQNFCPEYAGAEHFRQQPFVGADKIITVDPAALLPHNHGMLGLFDILQKISTNTHVFFDQEQQTT